MESFSTRMDDFGVPPMTSETSMGFEADLLPADAAMEKVLAGSPNSWMVFVNGTIPIKSGRVEDN